MRWCPTARPPGDRGASRWHAICDGAGAGGGSSPMHAPTSGRSGPKAEMPLGARPPRCQSRKSFGDSARPAGASDAKRPPLREILHKCLAKDPAHRFSAAEVRLILEAVAPLRRRDATRTRRSHPERSATAALAQSDRPDRICRTRTRTRSDGTDMDAGDQRPAPPILIAGDPELARPISHEVCSRPSRVGGTVPCGTIRRGSAPAIPAVCRSAELGNACCPVSDLRAQLAAIGAAPNSGFDPGAPASGAGSPPAGNESRYQRYRLFEAVAGLLAPPAARPDSGHLRRRTGPISPRC
jgi:hypothetical protein